MAKRQTKNVNIFQFHAACEAVLSDCLNPYAKAYAKAGLDMFGTAARTQASYILANTQNWRGNLARETKDVLRDFAGQ